MNKFTKSYHRTRRAQKARARAAEHERQRKPYRVTVYQRRDNISVETSRYSSYEAATSYAERFRDFSQLGVYIEYEGGFY